MIVCSKTLPVFLLLVGFSTNGLTQQTSAVEQTRQYCSANSSNFTAELNQSFASTAPPNRVWGPAIRQFNLNPELAHCPASGGFPWMQQRVLAAADYLIGRKMNYCHHHVPDYMTPIANRGAAANKGGYCSPALDIMPGSPYLQQQARWNYSGVDAETAQNWLSTNMWYGVDCSNYTALIYNFALGIKFTGHVSRQAGQRQDGSQNDLYPNLQSSGNALDNPYAAGKLVCRDNQLEANHSCGKAGYISAWDESGNKNPASVTPAMLSDLQPDDLLYMAHRQTGSATQTGSPRSVITHVVMWTGKKIGYGNQDIPPEKIAPNITCARKTWLPVIGEWVITDSHYQGPDYRMLTPCFYLNNLWGVRRIIK